MKYILFWVWNKYSHVLIFRNSILKTNYGGLIHKFSMSIKREVTLIYYVVKAYGRRTSCCIYIIF